jgi:hypothetical protein
MVGSAVTSPRDGEGASLAPRVARNSTEQELSDEQHGDRAGRGGID